MLIGIGGVALTLGGILLFERTSDRAGYRAAGALGLVLLLGGLVASVIGAILAAR